MFSFLKDSLDEKRRQEGMNYDLELGWEKKDGAIIKRKRELAISGQDVKTETRYTLLPDTTKNIYQNMENNRFQDTGHKATKNSDP